MSTSRWMRVLLLLYVATVLGCICGCEDAPEPDPPPLEPGLRLPIDVYLSDSDPITYEYIPIWVNGGMTHVFDDVPKRTVVIQPRTDARAMLDIFLAEPLGEHPWGITELPKSPWWHDQAAPELSPSTSILSQETKRHTTRIVVSGTFVVVFVDGKEELRGFTKGCLGAALPLLRPQDTSVN